MTQYVNATAKLAEKRFPLESVDGGWVKVRRMDHGESTERLDIALTFETNQETIDSKNPGALTRVATRATRHFEFEACVVDHNLGNPNGDQLDFSDSKQVDSLEPAVGDEIATLIREFNDFDAGDEEAPGSDPLP